MISTFTIEGFKVFERLSIDRLARLNLFVGENNVGKSCLLEAIRLWTSGGSFSVLRGLIHSRDADWEETAARRRSIRTELAANAVIANPSSEDPLRFLFHNFSYKDGSSPVISLGPADGIDTLRISLGRYRTLVSDDGTERRVRTTDQLSLESDGDDDEWMLEIENQAKRRVFGLDTFWGRRAGLRFASPFEDATARPVTTVGTNGLSSIQAAFLWDQVSLLPQQSMVLSCLKLIEPEIEGLTFVGDSDSVSDRLRIPVITLRGRKGRFPLKAMGDGLTRLFHIALAIVNAQDGTVLIDEFENGVYWEIQYQLWPLIFDMASQFNVQVFATSHSSDCLTSFVDAAARDEGSGSLFRVERLQSGASVRPLPIVNVKDALASQVEIR